MTQVPVAPVVRTVMSASKVKALLVAPVTRRVLVTDPITVEPNLTLMTMEAAALDNSTAPESAPSRGRPQPSRMDDVCASHRRELGVSARNSQRAEPVRPNLARAPRRPSAAGRLHRRRGVRRRPRLAPLRTCLRGEQLARGQWMRPSEITKISCSAGYMSGRAKVRWSRGEPPTRPSDESPLQCNRNPSHSAEESAYQVQRQPR